MSKIKIALLYGGTSNERGVSLSTGNQVTKFLDRKKYEVKKYDTKTQLKKLFDDCRVKKIDLCFIALHGRGGEDGTIQGMLDLLNVPYTGSGVLSSAMCMDKTVSKKVLAGSEISLADDIVISKSDDKRLKIQKIKKSLKLPVVVKPNESGSSVGITIAKTLKQLEKGITDALKYDDSILIEKYIKGIEITVPVLGRQALPVIEICPKTEFFDFKAKYDPKYCDEIVPARIDVNIAKQAQKFAVMAHTALKCEGLSRVDFILSGKKLFFLEINTIPGMTPNSLCPKSALVGGYSFTKLLDKIIDLALNGK